jgi:two-component system, OmpR family, phosphate regulon sensor histidine kinase PhoR
VPGNEGSEKRLVTVDVLLSKIPDPIIVIDRQMIVREANDEARVLLPALRVAQPLFYALRAPDILAGVERVLTSAESLHIELHQRVPVERTFDVQISAFANASEGGQGGVMLFLRDLTAARRLEQMRADFVANVSHELRTPLASVVGFIETLQGPARDDPAARDRFLEIMRGQAWRMTRLIDDLLSLSRIELRAHISPTSPVDLRLIAGEIVEAQGARARERGVEIVLSTPDEPMIVAGDRDELLRLLENLIENAVNYGGTGGRVEVTLARSAANAHPRSVELSVKDHGPGIAPEHLPRLTERFYRVDVAESRHKGGTGLGLAIVKHIVARHRGRMAIESELGHGAKFTVVLPEGPAGKGSNART